MRLTVGSTLLLLLLKAVPSLAVPNNLTSSIVNLHAKRDGPEANTGCTDLCTTDCIEICSDDAQANNEPCTNLCTYNELSVTTGGNFCLNVGASASGTGASSTVGVVMRGTSIQAAGDININIINRSSDAVTVVYVEDVILNAGGRIRINFGEGPRCIGENCRVLVHARNVRWTSALTGGEERRLIEQVYSSEADRTLIWQ